MELLRRLPARPRLHPDLERLVALVAEQSQARRLNLIAFSCGSPLLAEALVRLRKRHPELRNGSEVLPCVARAPALRSR